jgi:hypothetical protein
MARFAEEGDDNRGGIFLRRGEELRRTVWKLLWSSGGQGDSGCRVHFSFGQ